MPSIIQADQLKSADGNTTYLNSGTLSNLTFPAGTVVGYEKNQTVISSQQNATKSYADITGSSITYTPSTGASFVVYECSFVETSTTSGMLHAYRFLVDGSITKLQDSYTPYYHGGESQFSTIRAIHRMIYSASGWTSDKVVKMQFRAYDSASNYGRLHENHYNYEQTDGTTLNSTDRYTDVDVTIYSVM